MIAEIQARMFRAHAVTTGVRQHVVSRPGAGVSKRMAKVVALILCTSLVVVFVFSQVMNWHIAATSSRMEKMEAQRHEAGVRNIQLLAARAQLSSREFVEQQALEKFQLYLPAKGQIKRL